MRMPMMGGSLYTLERTMRLQMQWQKRRNDPTTPKGRDESPEMKHLREQARSAREGSVLAGIDNKLKAGKRLTAEEKSYLKLNAPQLYQQAVEAEAEREGYKRALERCRTQEEVERLNTQKMQSMVSEIGKIANNPHIPEATKLALAEQINRRSMGIQAEQDDFVRSGKLANLPTEQEERDRIEAERERLTGETTEQPAEEEQVTEEQPAPPPKQPDEPSSDQGERPDAPPPVDPPVAPAPAPTVDAPKAVAAKTASPKAQGAPTPASFLTPFEPQQGKARLARRA